jgi:hypothetical protein
MLEPPSGQHTELVASRDRAKYKCQYCFQEQVITALSYSEVENCKGKRCKFNPLKPSGYYTYHQFYTQNFYVLPTQCIYVFCVDLRTNNDYFPIQH